MFSIITGARGFSAVIAGASKSLRLIVSWALSGHSCYPLFSSSSSYCVLWLQLPSYENRFVYGFFLFLKQGHTMQFRLALNSQSSHLNLYSARSPGVCCHAWLTDECRSLLHKNTRILLENTFNFSIKIISV